MLATHLKLALRNIGRNKLYSFINVTGLSVASAFCILVYLYVANERSFDNFHHDSSRIFRVEQTAIWGQFDRDQPKKNFFSFLMKDAETRNMIQTPTSLAVELKRNFPEVEYAIRFEGIGNQTVRAGDKTFKEKDDNMTLTDADFFKVFNYPLIYGDPATVIKEPNHAAISERLAIKYFGTVNCVGKVITLPNEPAQSPITISGVFKNFPANSSYQFDFLMNVEGDADYKDRLARGVNTFSDPLIIKLNKGANVTELQHKMNVFAENYFKPLYDDERKHKSGSDPQRIFFTLRPFSQAHYNQSVGWPHYTDLKNIYQLICLTVIILLIACLNYVLLSLTNTVSRSQDVGVRKTIGAGRRQIIMQYYIETQLLAFFAVVLGLIIAVTCLPLFNNLTGTEIHFSNIPYGTILLFMLALAVVLGLLAGIYPAMAMSGLRPLNMMRSFSAYKISPLLSRVLIVAQFTVCVILIISSTVINRQMHYVSNADMGFNKDQILVLKSPYGWQDKNKPEVLKQRLYNYAATDPGLVGASSSAAIFAGFNSNAFDINGQKTMIQVMSVDYNYLPFLNVPIVAGRNFSAAIPTDTAAVVPTGAHKFSTARRSIVVNQTLYNMIGKPDLGVYNNIMGGIIIGVCKDIHTEDLTKKIQPAYFIANKYPPLNVLLRIRAGQSIPAEVEKIQAVWKKLTGNLPMEYTFMDAEVAKSYDAYVRWTTTITTSCVVAIILACLGLFGLSGLTTINRTKEIGIRKVLGASVTNLFLLINRETFYLSLTAFVIAVPVAAYFTQKWLENFAYRIQTGWLMFAAAGVISIVTAIIAVSYHTIKAAMTNPVESLRSE